MNLRSESARHASCPRHTRGYTLVEILVALTLTLILMTAVVKVFGDVGPSISNARKALEQFDRLRTAGQQLGQDLNNITARLDGRAGRPEEALGYFELIEGSYLFLSPQTPKNPVNPPGATGNYPYYAINVINPTSNTPTYQKDYSVGERGDVLMFTARNAARPYVGRYNPTGGAASASTVQSDVAEIAWYLRGNRLHRRVLLVVPGAAQALAYYPAPNRNNTSSTYYNDNDVSARLVTVNGRSHFVPNSLADLTKRENRFAHDARQFPFDVRGWGALSLPTLAECSSPSYMNANWTTGSTPAPSSGTLLAGNPKGEVDMWDNSQNGAYSVAKIIPDQSLNNSPNPDGLRVSDDVVLTNVIGFDVKVWDPGVPTYSYSNGATVSGGTGAYVDFGASYTSGGTPNGAGSPVTLVANQPHTYVPAAGSTYPRFVDMSNLGYYGSYYGCQSGIFESGLASSSGTPQCVYDSGCFSYSNELGNSQATNGLDDSQPNTPGYGIVDDLSEYILTSSSFGSLQNYAPGIPPYPVPLRGIQVKIRCFEPDSKQVREITIEHDFLPK